MISGKTIQKSAVTCITWPTSQTNYVVGLADGKVSKHNTIPQWDKLMENNIC